MIGTNDQSFYWHKSVKPLLFVRHTFDSEYPASALSFVPTKDAVSVDLSCPFFIGFCPLSSSASREAAAF